MSTIVVSSGVLFDETISSGSTLIVEQSGVSNEMQVFGTEIVSDGGFARASFVMGGGVMVVGAGGSGFADGIESGGEQLVSSGGYVVSTIVSSGGWQRVTSGGSVVSTSIDGGQLLLSGAAASAVSTYNFGGVVVVESGAQANGTYDLGDMYVDRGGDATNTRLFTGTQVVEGVAGTTYIFSSGSQVVAADGSAVSTTVAGTQIISDHGVAQTTIVISGGRQSVDSLGSAIDTTIAGSATQTIQGGYALSTTVSVGGTQIVAAGGSAVDTDLAAGAVQIVSGGVAVQTDLSGAFQTITDSAIALDTVIRAGGMTNIGAGGVAYDTIISAYGEQIVSAAGTAIGTVIGSGGEQIVLTSALTAQTLISGGTELIYGGTDSGGTVVAGSAIVMGVGSLDATRVMSHGAVIVSQGGVLSFGYAADGGHVTVTQGGTIVDTYIVSGGVATILSGGNFEGVVESDGKLFISQGGVGAAYLYTGGKVYVASASDAGGVYFHSGGGLVFENLDYQSGGTISFTSRGEVMALTVGGHTIDVPMAHMPSGFDYSASDFKLVKAAGNHLEVVCVDTPCFAAGTMIQTIAGDVAVENLTAGDRLPTLVSGKTRTVRWVGYRHTDIAHHPTPEIVRPVCVKQDSLAPGVPSADLWLSPQHALYVTDQAGAKMLAPVRHFINGATVVQQDLPSVTYYHVELEDEAGDSAHDVILAHGVGVETYLDTGNRGAFSNGGEPVMLFPDFGQQGWQGNACAELVDGGPRLAAMRALLAYRATELGFGQVTDPDLHVLADGGRVEPQRIDGAYHFALPAARSLRLVSRVFMPAQALPDNDDQRVLGVAVASLALDGAEIALTDARLGQGWHGVEPGWRCTKGDAVLPRGRDLIVRLHASATCLYWAAAHGDNATIPAPKYG